jgi:hypothetical protein
MRAIVGSLKNVVDCHEVDSFHPTGAIFGWEGPPGRGVSARPGTSILWSFFGTCQKLYRHGDSSCSFCMYQEATRPTETANNSRQSRPRHRDYAHVISSRHAVQCAQASARLLTHMPAHLHRVPAPFQNLRQRLLWSKKHRQGATRSPW